LKVNNVLCTDILVLRKWQPNDDDQCAVTNDTIENEFIISEGYSEGGINDIVNLYSSYCPQFRWPKFDICIIYT
jgi:hypothetical protein